MRKGLAIFKEKGKEAVSEELQQLHDMKAIDPYTPSLQDRRAALNYIMYLKQKRCGRIKARGCAELALI